MLDLVEHRERRGGVSRGEQPFADHLAQQLGGLVQRLASGELVGGEHRIRRGRGPAEDAAAFPFPRSQMLARAAVFRPQLLGSFETVRSSSEVADVARGDGCPHVRVKHVTAVRQDGSEAVEFVDVGVRQGDVALCDPSEHQTGKGVCRLDRGIVDRVSRDRRLVEHGTGADGIEQGEDENPVLGCHRDEVGVHTVGAERQRVIEFHDAPGIAPKGEGRIKAVGQFGLQRAVEGVSGNAVEHGDSLVGSSLAEDVDATGGEGRVVGPAALSCGVVECDEDVVAFPPQRTEDRGLDASLSCLECWADRNDGVEVVAQMAIAKLVRLGGVVESAGAVLADGLEHPVSRWIGLIVEGDERLGNESIEQVQHFESWDDVVVAAHRLGGVEGASSCEHRQPPEQHLLGFAEQVVAPGDRRLQRRLTRKHPA